MTRTLESASFPLIVNPRPLSGFPETYALFVSAWADKNGLSSWYNRNKGEITRMIARVMAFYGEATEKQKKARDRLNDMLKLNAGTPSMAPEAMLALWEGLPAGDEFYERNADQIPYFTGNDFRDAAKRRGLSFTPQQASDQAMRSLRAVHLVLTQPERWLNANFKSGVTMNHLKAAWRFLSPFDPFWDSNVYQRVWAEWEAAIESAGGSMAAPQKKRGGGCEERTSGVCERPGVVVKEQKEYRYAAVNRPPGFGTVPKGYLRIEPAPAGNPIPRHGVVVYDRPLTDKEIYDFELYPYKTVQEIADLVEKAMADYKSDYEESLTDKYTLDTFLKHDIWNFIPAHIYSDLSNLPLAKAVTKVLFPKIDLKANPRRIRKNPDDACNQEYVYDSEGRKYPVTYRVVAAALDGSTVVTSHNPQTFGWQTDPPLSYPTSFQTRDLGNTAESTKINQIAANLEPIRLLGKNLDPTLGPPVVWPHKGRFYVLGGNGRTMAFLRASEASYLSYLALAKCRWACFPENAPPPKHRWLLVREVAGLTEAQATQLAAASQKSTAATENKIAEAIGLVRSLDLDPADMPVFKFNGPLTPENVEELRRPNITPEGLREESPGGAFFQYIVARLNPAARSKIQQDPSEAARYLEAAVIGLLPKEAQRPSLYEDSKSQDALLGAAAVVVATHSWALHKKLLPEYDLWTALQEAVPLFQTIRTRSPLQIRKAMDTEREQGKVAGAKRISDAPPLAWALALALRAAAGTAQPEARVADLIRPYYEVIQTTCYRPEEKPTMGFMFSMAPTHDPCENKRKPAGDLFAESLRDSGISGSDTFYKNYWQIVHGEVPSGASRALFNNPALIDNRSLPTIGTLLTVGKFTSAHDTGTPAPQMRWMDPITPETAKKFQNENPAFYAWAVKHLGENASWQQAADAILGAMLIAMPGKFADSVYHKSPGVQRNVVANLPILLTLHQGVQAGEVAAGYDPGRGAPAFLVEAKTPQEAREKMLDYADRAFRSDPRQSRLFGNGKRRR